MPREPDTPARLMTAPQLCAYLGGIGSSTLHRWIHDRIIPGPLKGTSRWDRLAVDAALNRASGLALTVANDPGDDPIAASRASLEKRFGHGRHQGQTSDRP